MKGQIGGLQDIINRSALVFVIFLFLSSLALTPVDGAANNETEVGEQLLYLVKEVVEVTSDWTIVAWSQGPDIISVRHSILEGSNAPGLTYDVSGLAVRLNKVSMDKTKVVLEIEAIVLEGDITASIKITKGDIESTKVEFFAYDKALSDFTKLDEFLNEGKVPDGGELNPRVFDLELSSLYDMPSATASVSGVSTELRKRIFAFYYPWYGNPDGPAGGWWHYEEVTDEDIVGSPDYPLIGAYDSGDENVILTQMTWARNMGIDGFIVSWWGINSFEDAHMVRILSAANEVGVDISIYYESVRDITSDDIVIELSYVSQYFSDPSFLKDSGRPVVFIYAVSAFGRDANFWLDVRRRVEANVGKLVLIGDTFDNQYLHVFDGFHSYNPLPEGDVKEFYRDAIDRMKLGLKSSDVNEAFSLAYSGNKVDVQRKSVSVTVIPGYDETEVRAPWRKVDRLGGAIYDRYWNAAIDLNAHSVLITSWNEWHEGTEIEPSREYGFNYLVLTKQFVEEYKGITLPLQIEDVSVKLQNFEMSSEGRGEGSIVLTTFAEDSAVIINMEVIGLKGFTSLDLDGEFYTYLKEQNSTYVSSVVPFVSSLSDLVIRVPFVADIDAPLLEIHVSAYGPLGDFHELFKDQFEIVAESTHVNLTSTSTLTIETSTPPSTTTVKSDLTESAGLPVAITYAVAIVVVIAIISAIILAKRS